MTGRPWSQPQLSGQFEAAIGSSVVEDNVTVHTAGDVLRELAQNEFDAGGSQMTVAFEHDHLIVAGTGKPIDKSGWDRLSVILGTGDVISSTGKRRKIKPKENGHWIEKFWPSIIILIWRSHFCSVVRQDGNIKDRR
jgi:hypothetical protein